MVAHGTVLQLAAAAAVAAFRGYLAGGDLEPLRDAMTALEHTLEPDGWGDCPTCGRRYSLNKSGRVRRHNLADSFVRCPGSGREPTL